MSTCLTNSAELEHRKGRLAGEEVLASSPFQDVGRSELQEDQKSWSEPMFFKYCWYVNE